MGKPVLKNRFDLLQTACYRLVHPVSAYASGGFPAEAPSEEAETVSKKAECKILRPWNIRMVCQHAYLMENFL